MLLELRFVPWRQLFVQRHLRRLRCRFRPKSRSFRMHQDPGWTFNLGQSLGNCSARFQRPRCGSHCLHSGRLFTLQQYTIDHGFGQGTLLSPPDGNSFLLPHGDTDPCHAQSPHLFRPKDRFRLLIMPLLQFNFDQNEPHFKNIQPRGQGRNQTSALHFAQIANCHLLRLVLNC